MDHLATNTDVEVAFARLESEMRRMAVMLLVGQAVLPPVVERLLAKL